MPAATLRLPNDPPSAYAPPALPRRPALSTNALLRPRGLTESGALPVAAPNDDAHLLRRVAEGDDDALRELYRDYARLAFAIAIRILAREDQAEDVVQEAFLRVWRNAGRFDSSKASFRTWFGRLVRNLCIDILRKKEPLQRAGPIEGVERWLAHSERIEAPALDRLVVREAFLRLPIEQSRVIEMAYFEGFTHKEIAASLAIPEGTVKSRMRLGLKKMRRQLDGGEAAGR